MWVATSVSNPRASRGHSSFAEVYAGSRKTDWCWPALLGVVERTNGERFSTSSSRTQHAGSTRDIQGRPQITGLARL